MRQLLISFLLIGVIIPVTIFFTSRISHSAKSPPTSTATPTNPILPTVPSEAADDSKPIPADVVKQDVLNRFNDVYKQKKIQADKLQIDLTAAKNDLAACDKLISTAKTKCVTDATNYINVINQKISNLKYDMNIIQKEIKDIGQ